MPIETLRHHWSNFSQKIWVQLPAPISQCNLQWPEQNRISACTVLAIRALKCWPSLAPACNLRPNLPENMSCCEFKIHQDFAIFLGAATPQSYENAWVISDGLKLFILVAHWIVVLLSGHATVARHLVKALSGWKRCKRPTE